MEILISELNGLVKIINNKSNNYIFFLCFISVLVAYNLAANMDLDIGILVFLLFNLLSFMIFIPIHLFFKKRATAANDKIIPLIEKIEKSRYGILNSVNNNVYLAKYFKKDYMIFLNDTDYRISEMIYAGNFYEISSILINLKNEVIDLDFLIKYKKMVEYIAFLKKIERKSKKKISKGKEAKVVELW